MIKGVKHLCTICEEFLKIIKIKNVKKNKFHIVFMFYVQILKIIYIKLNILKFFIRSYTHTHTHTIIISCFLFIIPSVVCIHQEFYSNIYFTSTKYILLSSQSLYAARRTRLHTTHTQNTFIVLESHQESHLENHHHRHHSCQAFQTFPAYHHHPYHPCHPCHPCHPSFLVTLALIYRKMP